MNFYIGMDLGTSGVKGVLFDKEGNIIRDVLKEYDIISLKDGYAEEDPNIWLNKAIDALKELTDVDFKNDIKGLGFSGQMHGLVLLDKDDNVLRNSIIWCDNRTDKEAKEITETIGYDKLLKITGNIAMPAFTLAKLLWVKNNEPNIYKKIAKAMLPKDYICYMLTNKFYGEYSDTSGMQIMDVNTLEYSKELLDKFDININIFPKLIKSTDIRGKLKEEYQKELGLYNCNIVGGGGDQAVGAIGSGVVKATDASIVLGSSGVIFSPLNELLILNGEVQTFLTCDYKKYHVMGVTNGCGTSLKWLRDNLFGLDYNTMSNMAEKINVGSNNLYYLPYLMGERTPILDNDARGIFFGIKNTTSKSEMIRAVMEGVGYSIKDVFELIPKDKDRIFISGGGAQSELYRKIIASMINRKVLRIDCKESPSLGAAILAMVGNNEYKSIEEACLKIIKIYDETAPIDDWVNYYNKGYKIYKEIYNNTKNTFKKMKEI
ncbi:MAG: xylulokinase [Acholeplasmatales bacterium]|nr:xylulokinase [Acholeplasmatales bacterium]